MTMTQFEAIKKVSNVIKINGGATVEQIAATARIDARTVRHALKVMGDAYIDRWDGKKEVFDVIEPPPPCPKPH